MTKLSAGETRLEMTKLSAGETMISEFRTELMRKMPMLGDILSHLDIVESDQIDTAGTDGRTIYYNMAFFQNLSKEQRNYVLLHELFHILLLHSKRSRKLDRNIWNIAADYVVNGLLDELKRDFSRSAINIERPSEGCFLDRYNGEAVEQLYRNIWNDNRSNLFNRVYILVRDGYDDGNDRKMRKLKISSLDMDLMGELTESEMEELEKEINALIEKAVARWSGDDKSGGMIRRIGFLKGTHFLPWNKLLKRFLDEAELDDSSYERPERKYLHMDLIIPGGVPSDPDGKINGIWAFIDSSGSISDNELNRFLNELCGICKQFDLKVNIGYWDTYMNAVYMNVSANKLAECIPQSMGGTDANAVYDYLKAQHINPKVMLILTDGDFYPVDDSITGRYKDKTIVVLTGRDKSGVKNMGKIAGL